MTEIDRPLLDVAGERRARARTAEGTRAPVELLELFELCLGATTFAVPVSRVVAVLDLQTATPVPGCPEHILGVVSHGDGILPVMDPARFLALPTDERDPAEESYRRLLVVSAGGFEVALVCDRVRGLLAVPKDALQPASVFQGSALHRFLQGEIESERGPVGVLDLVALLESARVG